jgi:hypothetical protein
LLHELNQTVPNGIPRLAGPPIVLYFLHSLLQNLGFFIGIPCRIAVTDDALPLYSYYFDFARRIAALGSIIATPPPLVFSVPIYVTKKKIAAARGSTAQSRKKNIKNIDLAILCGGCR